MERYHSNFAKLKERAKATQERQGVTKTEPQVPDDKMVAEVIFGVGADGKQSVKVWWDEGSGPTSISNAAAFGCLLAAISNAGFNGEIYETLQNRAVEDKNDAHFLGEVIHAWLIQNKMIEHIRKKLNTSNSYVKPSEVFNGIRQSLRGS